MTLFTGRSEPGLSLLVSYQETHGQKPAHHTQHGFVRTTVFDVILSACVLIFIINIDMYYLTCDQHQ